RRGGTGIRHRTPGGGRDRGLRPNRVCGVRWRNSRVRTDSQHQNVRGLSSSVRRAAEFVQDRSGRVKVSEHRTGWRGAMTRSKMKTKSDRQRGDGFSLALVLVFTGVLFLLLSGVLALTTTNANLTQRYNEYYDSVAAAEAATEKVVTSMARDFQSSGVSGVDGNLANYGASIPTPAEVSDWGSYQFNDPSSGPNATYATKLKT